MRGDLPRFGEHIFQWPQHQRKRSAKFVAHVAEKQGLAAIDLRQSLGPLLLFFISARISNACGNLPGNQTEESGVAYVQWSRWIQPCNEHSSRSGLGLTRNRQEQRSRGRAVPGSLRNTMESLAERLND